MTVEAMKVGHQDLSTWHVLSHALLLHITSLNDPAFLELRYCSKVLATECKEGALPTDWWRDGHCEMLRDAQSPPGMLP